MSMEPLIIIQARLSSTRLPKKVLLPLCNRTVLEVMIDRLDSFRDNIVIATTDKSEDDEIVELCKKIDIKYFRGDLNNVLKRYFDTASFYGAKEKSIIVRLTSDCPFSSAKLIRKMIDSFKNRSVDYLSNTQVRTYPRGFDIEIFNFKSLKIAYENAVSDFEREHVTTFIYSTNREKFKLASYENSIDNSKYRLTLDEPRDYEAIKELYSKLNNKIGFSYKKLIEVLEQNPYIYEMNREVEQKKV